MTSACGQKWNVEGCCESDLFPLVSVGSGGRLGRKKRPFELTAAWIPSSLQTDTDAQKVGCSYTVHRAVTLSKRASLGNVKLAHGEKRVGLVSSTLLMLAAADPVSF